MKNRIINLVPIFSVAIAVVIYGVVAKIVDSEFILPTISQTIKEFLSLFSSGKFYISVLSTLLRSVIAFVISYILAFLLAYFSYKSLIVKKFFAPFVAICRALPTVAVVLLLLFWTSSKVAPVIVTFLVIFPTLTTELTNCFTGLNKTHIEMARLDRAKEIQILFKIIVPQILPEIFLIIGSGLSLNIKLMVASEVLAQTANSLGIMITIAKSYFEIANMIALVLVSVLISVLVEYVFKHISKKVGKYRE